jgi:hypothetical protein
VYSFAPNLGPCAEVGTDGFNTIIAAFPRVGSGGLIGRGADQRPHKPQPHRTSAEPKSGLVAETVEQQAAEGGATHYGELNEGDHQPSA